MGTSWDRMSLSQWVKADGQVYLMFFISELCNLGIMQRCWSNRLTPGWILWIVQRVDRLRLASYYWMVLPYPWEQHWLLMHFLCATGIQNTILGQNFSAGKIAGETHPSCCAEGTIHGTTALGRDAHSITFFISHQNRFNICITLQRTALWL